MSVASCSAALVAPAARITAARRSSSMSTAFVALRAPQQHGSVARGALQQRARRAASIVAQAAPTDTGAGKLISKVEIPAFIPRYDLIDQLLRWASIEVQENGVANVGCPCKVTTYVVNEELWGFTVSFLKDGVSVCDVRVAFDDDVTLKHEWVGRGADGMPVLEGKAEEVKGKNFEIRKVCDNSISEATRASIRDFCQLLVTAINKYYAFGSCFVDDST